LNYVLKLARRQRSSCTTSSIYITYHLLILSFLSDILLFILYILSTIWFIFFYILCSLNFEIQMT